MHKNADEPELCRQRRDVIMDSAIDRASHENLVLSAISEPVPNHPTARSTACGSVRTKKSLSWNSVIDTLSNRFPTESLPVLARNSAM